MSTAEIIAELPRLSTNELLEVEAKLRQLIKMTPAPAQRDSTPAHTPRIYSPRLANPAQIKDFVKLIVEPAPDAKL